MCALKHRLKKVISRVVRRRRRPNYAEVLRNAKRQIKVTDARALTEIMVKAGVKPPSSFQNVKLVLTHDKNVFVAFGAGKKQRVFHLSEDIAPNLVKNVREWDKVMNQNHP